MARLQVAAPATPVLSSVRQFPFPNPLPSHCSPSAPWPLPRAVTIVPPESNPFLRAGPARPDNPISPNCPVRSSGRSKFVSLDGQLYPVGTDQTSRISQEAVVTQRGS